MDPSPTGTIVFPDRFQCGYDVHPASYVKDNRNYFYRLNQSDREADRSPHSSVDVKVPSSETLLLTCMFVV